MFWKGFCRELLIYEHERGKTTEEDCKRMKEQSLLRVGMR